MTATPTPLRERLLGASRHVNSRPVRALLEEAAAALSARDEAGAVCRVCDGGPGNNGVCLCGMREYATPPAASGVEYHHEQIGGGAWVVAASDRGTWLYNFGYGEQAEIFAAGIAKLLNDELRRLAAVAPAGMVLVPREPTSDMKLAGADALDNRERGRWVHKSMDLVWTAMLAAAPTPPAAAGEESGG